MFKLVAFALVALVALSAVNGAPVSRRQTPPASWDADILEPYDQYHTRYLAIGCQYQHNTTFFDDCCHPLKKGETLENNRKPYCAPGYNSSPAPDNMVSTPTSSPAPEPSPPSSGDDDCDDDGNNNDDGNDGNDEEDDGDCEDEPSYISSYEPSSSPAVPSPTYNPEPTTSPTPTPAPGPSPSTSTSTDDSSPTPSPTQDQSPGSETHTGGHLTWFTQNGVAGACGTVHSDSDFIAALDTAVYGDTGVQSSYCGKTIRITWQGNSVDVIVADACPTCDNAASVDLSEAAFQALAPLSTGLLTDATWTLLN